ncbi:MAG: hypothetical protein HRT90_00280 [Candidatus Margulisbacteria bacterium]|nr:hypothetical protein [Candidatus Margulisiibacteriota bacterium]
MISFIRTYTLRYWKWYFAGMITLVITAFVTVLNPLKIKDAIDLIQMEGTVSLQSIVLSIIGLAIILMISRTLSRIFIFTPGRYVEYDLRNDLYRHLMTLSKDYYRGQHIGDLMSRLTNDIRSLRAMVAFAFLHLLNIVLIYGFVLYNMTKIHVFLTIFTLLPIPIAFLFIKRLVKRLHRYVKESQERLGALTQFIVESIGSILLIKSYGSESTILEAFETENKHLESVNIKLSAVRGAMFPFITIVGSLGTMILF